jgi:hypothetical protein
MAKSEPMRTPPASPAPTSLEVCQMIDDFQRTYQANAMDDMPGNAHYAGKLMVIVAAARSALAAAPSGAQWQGIESAPKDGTCVLCWTPSTVAIARWDNGEWWFREGRYVIEATHWMPLPASPETKGNS